ncbi:hypothetical protein [Oceanicoccus sagamiensis]|uniref:Uncharacterized protein n=1 Tax=Oceanicoccus sagamiensis TaxID=716816 RepID=A0A1X9NG55_9GAMM|nr:hypothetical protein [Oceanicoccus sagamiensis]ARN76014.1 hypothetical protein BST96_19095 [Oceanicoccus sagamiensis]
MSGSKASEDTFLSLKGEVLKEVSSVRFLLDIGRPEDFSFTYCLCSYLLFEGLAPVKLHFSDADKGNSVFAENVSVDEFNQRYSGFSGRVFCEDFFEYSGLRVEDVFIFRGDDNNDILSVTLFLEYGLELHLVSFAHLTRRPYYGALFTDQTVFVFSRGRVPVTRVNKAAY